MFLYCVAISKALGWSAHTNYQGAEMAFEEAPFEARQPLHFSHHSSANKTLTLL